MAKTFIKFSSIALCRYNVLMGKITHIQSFIFIMLFSLGAPDKGSV